MHGPHTTITILTALRAIAESGEEMPEHLQIANLQLSQAVLDHHAAGDPAVLAMVEAWTNFANCLHADMFDEESAN